MIEYILERTAYGEYSLERTAYGEYHLGDDELICREWAVKLGLLSPKLHVRATTVETPGFKHLRFLYSDLDFKDLAPLELDGVFIEDSYPEIREILEKQFGPINEIWVSYA